MTVAGPNLPTSASNNGTNIPVTSSVAWTNVTNVLLDDGTFATSSTSLNTQYAMCTGFGFAVPGGSTINGIVASVNKKGTNSIPNADYVYDQSVKLIKAGSIVGSDKADTTTKWSATLTSVDYGGSGDLWGTTWSVAEVNASDFGIGFSADPQPGDTVATGSVDSIKLTIYYTASGGANQGIMF